MRKPGPPGLTRDRAPGKPEGAAADPLGTRRLRARRGDDSVQVVSPWAYRPRGPQSLARAGSASPAVLGRQSSFQRLGSGGGGRVCPRSGAGSAVSSCARPAPAESTKSPSRPRDCSASSVFLLPSEARGGVRACVRVCECARARRHACAPPTHACFYLLAAAATGAMTAKDAASAGRHPARPHRGSASASAQKGYRWTGSREAARPPANRRAVLS